MQAHKNQSIPHGSIWGFDNWPDSCWTVQEHKQNQIILDALIDSNVAIIQMTNLKKKSWACIMWHFIK